ncbi:hypothetical protein CMO84_06730 [Candidatus Woesearchaeota archaeon]|nr:hypothetical protein [Candidatus Woesearchaeota archaeon]
MQEAGHYECLQNGPVDRLALLGQRPGGQQEHGDDEGQLVDCKGVIVDQPGFVIESEGCFPLGLDLVFQVREVLPYGVLLDA